MSHFSRLVVASAIVAGSLLVPLQGASADHKPKKVAAPFGWEQIDRNHDGDVSKKEWKWAERHGYDRLTRHGGSVNRKTYQAALNRYLAYLDWRQQQNQQHWYSQQDWNRQQPHRAGQPYGRDQTHRLTGVQNESAPTWYPLGNGGRD